MGSFYFSCTTTQSLDLVGIIVYQHHFWGFFFSFRYGIDFFVEIVFLCFFVFWATSVTSKQFILQEPTYCTTIWYALALLLIGVLASSGAQGVLTVSLFLPVSFGVSLALHLGHLAV